MNFIILLIGLAVLIKSADWLVTGSSSIARRFGISPLVIGLTVVAFGTSAPELAVNLISVFQGSTQLAIGNIIGSNIANILLILGVTAIIYPLNVKKSTAWKEIPLVILASVLVTVMANDVFFGGASSSALGRLDGIILLGFFGFFLYYIYTLTKIASDEPEEVRVISIPRSLGATFVGILGLVLGGKVLVDSAVIIAQSFGVSEAVIGLTVVAVGTSLPELATSVVAAFKKQSDIAIGNIVGSNLFNIFWILGLSSLIKPLPTIIANNFDFFVAIGSSLLLFIFVIGKKHKLSRWQGVVFLLLYVAYVVTLLG